METAGFHLSMTSPSFGKIGYGSLWYVLVSGFCWLSLRKLAPLKDSVPRSVSAETPKLVEHPHMKWIIQLKLGDR